MKNKPGALERVCKICSKVYPNTNEHFNYLNRKKGWLRSYCKKCNTQSTKEWTVCNREKVNKSSKKYYSNNKDKHYKLTKKYKKENAETVKLKTNKTLNEKYKNDKTYNLNVKIATSMRRALKGNKKGRKWEELVGYSVSELILHIEKLFTKDMSWDKLIDGKIHIDHIISKSSFVYTNSEDEEFKNCWALTNLQPLWAVDNMKKHNKLNWILI